MLFGHGKKKSIIKQCCLVLAKKKVSSNNVVWSWRKKKYHQTTLFGHGENFDLIKRIKPLHQFIHHTYNLYVLKKDF